ncbi:MAG: dCTP deaminase [archaeon]
MILTRKDILEEIKKGTLKIIPFDPKNVGPVSVDLTLWNEFRIFTKDTIDLKKDDFRKVTRLIKADKIEIKPDELILGITKEELILPDNIVGKLSGRSRYARMGLIVHMTSNLVLPGCRNRQVLEIKNASNSNMILYKGLKLCQIMFDKLESRARYRGEFHNQMDL